jgi:hypothetical protein
MPKTKEVSKAAAARLNQLLAAETALAPDKYHAVAPEVGPYNVFGPEYAGSLAANTGVPAANILNQRALGVNAEEERAAYAAAQQAANENERYLQIQGARIKAHQDVAEHDLDPTINKGVNTASVLSDPNNLPYIQVNPASAAVQTSENLNTQHSGTLKDTASAAKDLYGIGIQLPDIGYMIAPAAQEKPTATKENLVDIKLDNGQIVQMTGSETNDYIKALAEGRKADAAMIAANAADYHAHHPSTGGSKTVVQYGPEAYGADGRLKPGAMPAVTTITNPGSDPPDYAPNPKPDVRSGGTSGKPSAASLPEIDLGPIKQIGAKYGTVTSTTRSTKHNREVGGVSNSFHRDYGHGGHAIDIVRGKGVTHKEIATAYQNAGYNLVESLDEGDHSHFAFGSGPAQAHASGGIPQQRRPVPGGQQRAIQLAQAKGYKVSQQGQNIVVHLPSGQTTTVAPDGSYQ